MADRTESGRQTTAAGGRTTAGFGVTGTGGAPRAGRVTQLGRYRVERQLGVGGSATVYLAIDTTIDKRVALKVLHEHLRDDSVTIRRFANDARALARLNHANIAQVFAAELDQYYFAMEYIEGQDLGRIIQASGSLPIGRAIGIALQMAEALAHIHAAGFVHRDVKPGNVLVAPGDRVKLTDFSVVQAAEETVLTLKGSLVGTVEYMAPEQIREEDADGRADIYALGAVLYEMLTGRPPFGREPGQTEMWPLMERILTQPPRDPAEIDPQIPGALASSIMKALAKKPAERFPDMHAFAESLRGALGDAPTIRIVPVALAEPVETASDVKLSWTESDALDFDRYEAHQSDVRDFVPSDATLIATIADRAATETAVAKWPSGGVRYFRVKSILRGGVGAVSNRVTLEIGRRPPVWKRREVQALAIVAMLASFAAAYLSRPSPHVVGIASGGNAAGADRVRIKGRFGAGPYLQTGAIQFTVAHPEVETVEAGAISAQIEGSPGTITVEVPRDEVAKLDQRGYDLALMGPQSVSAEGTLAHEAGTSGGIILHASDVGRMTFEEKAPAPRDVTSADWKDFENSLVRIRGLVDGTSSSGNMTVGYIHLEGFGNGRGPDAEQIVVFRGVRSALEARKITLESLDGKMIAVVGKVTKHRSYGWQIILARPEHIEVQ